ncbi:divergent polysaccharide deacetylase family protein [Candidatus Latescibacterota bacterium]
MPLAALIILSVSTYLWYLVLRPESTRKPFIIPFRTSATSFSSELESNLRALFTENGIAKNNISVSVPDSTFEEIYNVYEIKIPENLSLTFFNAKIHRMAQEMGGRVFQGIENSDGNRLTIKVGAGKNPTDLIILSKIKTIQAPIARIALIVDDLGIRNLDSARRLCGLEQVVTLSILPFQSHTSDVIEIARETGTPYILHMPMEPTSASANPGEGAIYTIDRESEINEKLEKAFKSVRGSTGLNNHMGSKATEDTRTMEIVMKYLSENNYFFVDSRTSNNSIGYSLSQKMGVKSAALFTYIDVEDDKDFMNARIDKIAEAAFEKGLVVAICHDRPNTIDLLEERLPELTARNITFIKVADIVR